MDWKISLNAIRPCISSDVTPVFLRSGFSSETPEDTGSFTKSEANCRCRRIIKIMYESSFQERLPPAEIRAGVAHLGKSETVSGARLEC
jgi:hypothetical protein